MLARGRVDEVQAGLRAVDPAWARRTRKVRALKAATALTEHIDQRLDVRRRPRGLGRRHRLGASPRGGARSRSIGCCAPLWDKRTAVLTSATIPLRLPERLGLLAERTDELDVGSPFDFGEQALLYCAAHLPDPRKAGFRGRAVHDELAALIAAAGGRTLALFTSWRAMQAAADVLRPAGLHPPHPERPAQARAARGLPARRRAACSPPWASCRASTSPGRPCAWSPSTGSPSPAPTTRCCRPGARPRAAASFRLVDLPRATTLLAQGAGRLIRTTTDRGVVAVLDPRLAKAGYRWDVVRALPPMRRTRHREEAEAFLRSITAH